MTYPIGLHTDKTTKSVLVLQIGGIIRRWMLSVVKVMRLRTSQPPRLLFLLFCIVALPSCTEPHARPGTYVIPNGYIGWVRVDYNLENAPPLPIENGRQLYRFPPSGKLQTSSTLEHTRGRDVEYFYASQDSRLPLKSTDRGGGGMIWGQFKNSMACSRGETKECYEYVFVGSEELYEKYKEREFRLNESGFFVKDSQLPKAGPIQVE